MEVPSVFATGYKKACALNPALAHLNITHMRIGDPDADPRWPITKIPPRPQDRARP